MRYDDLDVETRQRIINGYARVPGPGIPEFCDAMAHECEANGHKGDPTAVSSATHAAELLYHAAKLVMAIRYGHRQAALEYAADCGNHAWMAAASAGVLDLDLLTSGLEGMTDPSEGLYDALPGADGLGPVDLENPEVQRKLREQPWIYRREFGGFYEQLKDVALRFGEQLDHLIQTEAARNGRRVPEHRDALGDKVQPDPGGTGAL